MFLYNFSCDDMIVEYWSSSLIGMSKFFNKKISNNLIIEDYNVILLTNFNIAGTSHVPRVILNRCFNMSVSIYLCFIDGL